MKHLIAILLIFCFVEVSAQKEQNFILSTNVGYNYTYEDKSENLPVGGFFLPEDKKINDLNFSMSAGRKFSSNFYYGLGFALNMRKEEWNPDVNKPYRDKETGWTSTTSNAVSENYVYSPLAFLQYVANLGERAQVTLSLISQYDFEKSTEERKLFQPGQLGDDNFITHTSRKESTREYFNAGLMPGFRMNLYKSFGLNIAFGSVAYRIKTAESRLPDMDIKASREFIVRFRPEDWRIGLHLTF
ncbi:MAG: hypothetical protein EA361_06285 [Bacteroidetes bacterium]|nr:MAG: hypothetical protein EA361_06285 [Bacteroidota bacterium]